MSLSCTHKNPIFYLFFFFFFLVPLLYRYYRANSVRYPTQACEGVCTLHHYCAITRVDYREFRQCLETAASALASNTRTIIGNSNVNRIFLLILTLIQLLVYKRKQFMSCITTLTTNFITNFLYSLCVQCLWTFLNIGCLLRVRLVNLWNSMKIVYLHRNIANRC